MRKHEQKNKIKISRIKHGLSCLLFIPFLLVLLAAGSGCQSFFSKPKEQKELSSLKKLSTRAIKKTKLGALRIQMLRDTALGVGARGGLASRGKELNALLQKHEHELFRIFNFHAIMLEKNVLPPVLIEGRNTLALAGDNVIRIADRNYQILTQAKFVTAPPNWRDYLWLSYSHPDLPDRSLLPKTREERIIWSRFIEEGWRAGLQQAEVIFKENLGRLKRDFQGMLRYRTLLAQNMVTPPYVAQMDLGVTGGGSNLTVNDRILRITAVPLLKANSGEWKTELIPHPSHD